MLCCTAMIGEGFRDGSAAPSAPAVEFASSTTDSAVRRTSRNCSIPGRSLARTACSSCWSDSRGEPLPCRVRHVMNAAPEIGLGGAADIEELLDPGSVLGPYGVLELLERLEGRAPSLPGPPRDERCARDDERAPGEQRELDARHGRLLLGTEYYAFPAEEASCSPVLPASPGSSYCSPRVAVPPRPPSCCGGIRTNSGGQSVVSGPACRSTAWNSSGLSMTGCGSARRSGIGAFPWTPARSVARGRL